MEMTTEPAKDINSEARNKLGDFLLVEYVHMSESFLRNEESGEKRAAFFVTLVGASGGILGFVFGEKTQLRLDQIFLVAAVVAAVLLCFGFLTVRRLIKRDIETDKIKFALRALRRLFLTRKEVQEVPNAFFNPYKATELRSLEWRNIGNGGWIHTVSFVNALLTGVFFFAACHTREGAVDIPWLRVIALVLALAGGAAVWIVQLKYARSAIEANQKELLTNDGFC
jgi:MFS family permease